MVVVLPDPFTPTTSTTWGRLATSTGMGWATGARISAMSWAKWARTSSPVMSLPKRSLARDWVSLVAVSTPMSAVISRSSSSSRASSSSLRWVNRPMIPPTKREEDRASPARNRAKKPSLRGVSSISAGASASGVGSGSGVSGTVGAGSGFGSGSGAGGAASTMGTGAGTAASGTGAGAALGLSKVVGPTILDQKPFFS
jgi:hypothetical protein